MQNMQQIYSRLITSLFKIHKELYTKFENHATRICSGTMAASFSWARKPSPGPPPDLG
jgi:hypothetical protein